MKHLKARTLTSLDNIRPQWMADAHTIFDVAVAAVCGWDARISEDETLITFSHSIKCKHRYKRYPHEVFL